MLLSTTVAILIISLLYFLVGIDRIIDCYKTWFTKEYWTDYNTVEFAAWFAKAFIIIPGLVFGIEVWYMHFITLLTSALLIWASMRKLLPTLVAFNSIWIWLSTTVIMRNLFN
jgi:hypothetical protein